jgi:Tfp pilus assembly protein PilO
MIEIPKIMVRKIAIIAVLLLLISVAMIYPNAKGLEALEAEAIDLRQTLEEQKTLIPVFNEMRKRTKSARKSPLPFPELRPLSTDEIRTALIDMKQRAEGMHLEVTDIVPGIRGFVENAQRVGVDISLLGDLNDFKAFLLSVSGEPFVEAIETIQIVAQTDRTQFRVTLWFARQTS